MAHPTRRPDLCRVDQQEVRRVPLAAGLPPELHPHCLRHSYVTHLIEDGFDPFFVQQQVSHAWGSTTALYTGVSSDFKNTMLRRALGPALEKEGHR